MVVLEAMYGADLDIVLSSTQPSLTQHLQAIVLADMLQVSSIVDALVQRLVIACRQQVETASQVALLMQSHSQLPGALWAVLPVLFQQYEQHGPLTEWFREDLMRQLLLDTYGNLDAAWADHRAQALALPL